MITLLYQLKGWLDVLHNTLPPEHGCSIMFCQAPQSWEGTICEALWRSDHAAELRFTVQATPHADSAVDSRPAGTQQANLFHAETCSHTPFLRQLFVSLHVRTASC